MLLLGRGLFALGGENMCVAESTIISYWFHGKCLALALATDTSVGRIGSVLMQYTAPAAYEAHGFGFACFLGFCMCLYSIGCTLTLAAIDKHAEKLYPAGRKLARNPDRFKCSDLYSFQLPFWLVNASCAVTFMSFYTYF